MRKIAFFAAATLLLASCGNNSSSNSSDNDLVAARDSLRSVIADQDSLLVLMNDIQQGLNDIKAVENIMNSADFKNETPNRREQIRNDMLLIQQTLQERNQRLADLENRLNRQNTNNANLQKAIATLRQQIANQESTIESLRQDLAAANIHIEALNLKVDTLNTVIAETNDAREAVERENEQLTNELNTCYYAIGSKKELKEHKLIETGFLRKTKIMPQDFEQNYFTRADKRTLSLIPLNSKKVKVLTNQPESSYTIDTDETGMKSLEITNPAEFWNTSNYVVIQVD